MSASRNVVPASVQFVDIGGLVEGASKGEGLGNRFLASIREVDAVVYVLRAFAERENLSYETASKLVAAGIPVALQSGYESYVPKTRVVLFEAALAAANGLSFDQALRTITIDAARILGIDNRVGSLEVGKDGDVALYDGDPFEYTTHCTACIIAGRIVSDTPR